MLPVRWAICPGDPELALTQQAFKTIKSQKAVEAFAKAFAVFPNSTPPKDAKRRLEIYQSKYTLVDAIRDKQSPDSIYMAAMKENRGEKLRILHSEQPGVVRRSFDSRRTRRVAEHRKRETMTNAELRKPPAGRFAASP